MLQSFKIPDGFNLLAQLVFHNTLDLLYKSLSICCWWSHVVCGQPLMILILYQAKRKNTARLNLMPLLSKNKTKILSMKGLNVTDLMSD